MKLSSKKLPVDWLRQCGLKVTRSRLAVINWLAGQAKPVSVAALKNGLGKSAPNQATLYRIVTELVKHGVVRRVDLGEVETYYEIFDPHDHHHVICLKCQAIEDVVLGDGLKLSQRALKLAKKFQNIKFHSLEFWGLCKNCARQ